MDLHEHSPRPPPPPAPKSKPKRPLQICPGCYCSSCPCRITCSRLLRKTTKLLHNSAPIASVASSPLVSAPPLSSSSARGGNRYSTVVNHAPLVGTVFFLPLFLLFGFFYLVKKRRNSRIDHC